MRVYIIIIIKRPRGEFGVRFKGYAGCGAVTVRSDDLPTLRKYYIILSPRKLAFLHRTKRRLAKRARRTYPRDNQNMSR